jgi:hypothetical protein
MGTRPPRAVVRHGFERFGDPVDCGALRSAAIRRLPIDVLICGGGSAGRTRVLFENDLRGMIGERVGPHEGALVRRIEIGFDTVGS